MGEHFWRFSKDCLEKKTPTRYNIKKNKYWEGGRLIHDVQSQVSCYNLQITPISVKEIINKHEKEHIQQNKAKVNIYQLWTFLRGQYVIYGPVRTIFVFGQYNPNRSIRLRSI